MTRVLFYIVLISLNFFDFNHFLLVIFIYLDIIFETKLLATVNQNVNITKCILDINLKNHEILQRLEQKITSNEDTTKVAPVTKATKIGNEWFYISIRLLYMSLVLVYKV